MAGGRGPRVPYRTVLTAYWALLVPLGLVYFLVPPSAQTAVGTVSILITAAAVAFGVVRNRPVRAAAWLLLGAALVTAAAANLTYALLPGPAGGVKTAMYVVNVMYLATFAFNIAGLLRLARPEQSRVDWASVIDAVILTLGLVLLVWIFLVVPLGRVASVTQAGQLAPMAYPIVDVLLLLATARFVSAVGRTVSATLLTAGMVGLVIYHLMLVVALLQGLLIWQTPADLLWLLGNGLLGTAALHPSMRRVVPVPAARPPEASPVRLVLLAVAALIPPTIMIWESTTGMVIHNPG